MRPPFKLRRPRHTVFEDDVGDDDDAPHPAMDYTPPPGLRLVRLVVAGGVALAVVVGGYAAIWFGLAWSFRTNAIDWAAAARADGRIASHGEMVVGGFPFDLRLTVPAPAYGDGPFAVAAETLVMEARPWSPGRVHARLSGPLQVTLPDGARAKPLSGLAQDMEGTVSFSRGLPSLLDLNIRGLSLADGAGRLALQIRDGSLLLTEGGDDEATYTLDVALAGVDISGFSTLAPALPLGPHVTGVHLTGALKGPVDEAAGAVRDRLVRWRDGGGTIELSRFQVDYGPLVLRATGTLSLDQNLQPTGALTAQAEGFFSLVDALWRHDVIRGRDAVTAKIVLGALVKKVDENAPDARPSLNMAVLVHNRVLYAGPAPLWRFPPVIWPEGPPPMDAAPVATPPAAAPDITITPRRPRAPNPMTPPGQ